MIHAHGRRDEHVPGRNRTDRWLTHARTTSRSGPASMAGAPVALDRDRVDGLVYRDATAPPDRVETVRSEHEVRGRQETHEHEFSGRRSWDESPQGYGAWQSADPEQPMSAQPLLEEPLSEQPAPEPWPESESAADDLVPEPVDTGHDPSVDHESAHREEHTTTQSVERHRSTSDVSHLRASQVRSSTGSAHVTSANSGSRSVSHVSRQRISSSVSAHSRRRGSSLGR